MSLKTSSIHLKYSFPFFCCFTVDPFLYLFQYEYERALTLLPDTYSSIHQSKNEVFDKGACIFGKKLGTMHHRKRLF